MEMSAEQLATRLLSEEARISGDRIRRGDIGQKDFDRFVAVSRDIAGLPIQIDDTPAITMSALRTRCRRLKRTKGLALVVVDYLQLMRPSAGTRPETRVLETSHPPVYYIPPADIAPGVLHPTARTSVCEWKGAARYYTVQVGAQTAEHAAWAYPAPTPAFQPIRDYVAFYPALMDACLIDGAPVQPQPGGFYGGWITPDIVGPFKGVPGSGGW